MVNAIRPIVHLEHTNPRGGNTFREISRLLIKGSKAVDVLSGPITSGIEGANHEVNFNAIIRAATNSGFSSTNTQTVRFGYEPARYWTTLQYKNYLL